MWGMSSHERAASSEWKACTKCGLQKPITEYRVKRLLVSGKPQLQAQCNACLRAWHKQHYERNKPTVLEQQAKRRADKADEIREYMQAYYLRNRDKIIAKTKAYQSQPHRKAADSERQKKRYEEDRESIRARQRAFAATPEGKAKTYANYRKHYEANPDYYWAKAHQRRASELRAMPKWITNADIRPFYNLAKKLTRETGTKFSVDHIVPLNHKKVCGLHVPWNLQVIPWIENCRKFNKLDDEIVRHSGETRRAEDKEPRHN